MKLSMLIAELTALQEEYDGQDPDVRVAYQPSWPLRAAVSNVCALVEGDDAPSDDELAQARKLLAEGDEEAEGFAAAQALVEDHPAVVWLALSHSSPWDESPYAPKQAWGEE